MIKIELKDEVCAALLDAIETGTAGGKAITTKGVAVAVGVDPADEAGVDDVQGALAIMKNAGLLGDFVTQRGKYGGFMRADDAAKRSVAVKAKKDETAEATKTKVAERTAKALKSGSLSLEALTKLLEDAKAEAAKVA